MDPPERTETFLRLLSRHQRPLASYVMTLVLDWNDTEDILQETNLVLWREFDKFELGTNFYAWACKIAFHQVLAFRKRHRRDQLPMSDQFLEAVAEEAIQLSDHLEQRHQALAHCIEKLPSDHRQILRLRYENSTAIETIAEKVGRSVGAVYRVLSRIRQSLHACVSRTFEAE